MSFILDALRKSEHERERKALPGLVDVPVAKPERAKVPALLIGLGALLAVNLVVLLVVLLRSGSPAGGAAPEATTPTGTAAPAAVNAPAGTAPNGPAPPSGYAPPTGHAPPAAGAAVPPAGAPATPLAGMAAARDVRPLEAEAGGEAATDENAPPYVEPPPLRRDPTLDGGTRVTRTPGTTYSDEPLDGIQPGPVPYNAATNAPTSASRASTRDGVPSIRDLTPQATAGLPALGLSLHVYAQNPAERFAVINGRRYQEGTTLQEGPKLERITPDGAILDWQGLRFLLPRQ